MILFGPGVGVSEEMKEMLEMVLKKGKKPLVIDADGLNIISRFNMKIDYPYGPNKIQSHHSKDSSKSFRSPNKISGSLVCKI